MNPKSLSLRPKTSVKSRFTKGFLQALKRIQGQRSRSPNVSSPREMCRRYLSVKIAADASMASAVGSRRAWSRALLTKIRSHGAPRVYKYSARRIDNSKKKKKKKKCEDGEEIGVNSEANELRKFVPGGEAMDICSLLDEAAHYIKCLNTQCFQRRRRASKRGRKPPQAFHCLAICTSSARQRRGVGKHCEEPLYGFARSICKRKKKTTRGA
ncbi:hypothetical protein PRUPE_8G190000 [Prunus persica]|uniref:IBH1-like N-terminal domain-containing protein n=1 Tax=Prunus persica TaxID=3760 RepID=A0A251N390_PRUPE|nr:transcription factor IBH1 [Prunus persica]ONH92694.1 hypothetical protein PRUPE_8G190000 [Prunus persica]